MTDTAELIATARAAKRSSKRASSRAHTPCPHCGKKLHGDKGLQAHLKEAHNG